MPNPLTVQIDPLGIWGVGLFCTTFLCSFFVIQKYFKEVGIFASVLWAYIIIYSLFLVEFPYQLFGNLNIVFQARAGQTLVEALVIPLAILTVSNKLIYRIIPWVIAIDLVCVWIFGKGMQGWSSFDNALVVSCLPLIYDKDSWIKKILIIASIITALSIHGNTALLILLVQALAIAIHYKPFRKLFILFVPAAIYFAHKHHVHANFDTGDRISQWIKIFNFWENGHRWNWLLGFGPGSFLYLSLLMDKFQAPLFLHAHNDWLQILFETGIAGLCLATGAFMTAVKRAWHNPRLLASVFGMGAFAVSYHPLRFGASMLLTVFIFKECFFYEREKK